MALEVGSRLGHYAVTALIGEGGMGQVYQATDTKLKRQVALKILPEAFATDPDRLARFQREAQVLASLNHPNIAAIHGLEDSEGSRALVLELVEGPTLADRIAQGPIPVDEALPIAKQIAEALEAAHEQGVIHRDLKPANIKVREDGTVKVLDFGLAKAMEGSGGDVAESPTVTAAATAAGVILGTAAYMSPEQARGKPVDKRADIWAFGVVLYEMLTGQRPFKGRDVSEVLAAVIQSAPDWDALPSDTPPHLPTVITRCLDKEPRRRARDMGDVTLAMEGGFASVVAVSGSETATRPTVWQRPIAGVIAGLAIASLAALGIWTTRSPGVSVPQPPVRSTINVPATEQLVIAGSVTLALSPDGRTVVYVAASNRDGSTRLYQRQIDELDAVPIPGTENVINVCFSPDGEWVAFRSGNALKKVRLSGGPAETICEGCGGSDATWTSNDTIIFSPGRAGLMQVSAAGGEPRPFLELGDGESDHRLPELLPGGRAILLTVRGRSADGEVVVHSLETGERRVLVEGTHPHFSPTGHLLFARGGSLWAVPFDPDRPDIPNDPVPVVEGIAMLRREAAMVAIAENGSLVYVRGGGTGTDRTFVWVDRNGREEPLPLPPRPYGDTELSPDGTRVAARLGFDELWVYDVASADGVQVAPQGTNMIIWTPDGERLIFSPQAQLHWVPADGGDVERLLTSDAGDYPTSVTPDGSTLLFVRGLGGGIREIWELPLDEDRTPRPVLQGDVTRSHAVVSPNGNWLAYSSDQSGQVEIYMQPYPGPGRTVQVSSEGGGAVIWSHDGSELFYRNGTSMMAVSVNADGTIGAPSELFNGVYFSGATPSNPRMYDVAPDGRFLMLKDEETANQIVLVQNWSQELTEQVPIP